MRKPEDYALTIQLPAPTQNTEEVLWKIEGILTAKAPLITKALGIQDCPVELVDNEHLGPLFSFAWFDSIPDPEVTHAASVLISKICEHANQATRVVHTPSHAVNERFAMRCWLVRLGLIGDEHKETRSVLIRNLTGDSGRKNPPLVESEK